MEAGGRQSVTRNTPDLLLSQWLVSFFASCILYFLLWLPAAEPSWSSALAKCLPILCLALFVHSTAPSGSYSQFIWVGLFCSALGDFVLTWPNLFLLGLAAFALAYVSYLKALGWHPLRLTLLEPVIAVFTLYLGILQPHLPSSLSVPVLVYAVTLGLMLWRALARGRPAALGGLFFGISDALQAWNTFIRPLPSGRLLIMVTYYAAQALMALSTVEGRAA
ncbi:lysoplasmalogenase TMEM86B-like [Notamacropus eugenii]|uniref:lysoplasmalogenase TMEM86B-like n=1 Tax=Notamacropus eugenii TaxID=9315 RepID=UPI003B6793D9